MHALVLSESCYDGDLEVCAVHTNTSFQILSLNDEIARQKKTKFTLILYSISPYDNNENSEENGKEFQGKIENGVDVLGGWKIVLFIEEVINGN